MDDNARLDKMYQAAGTSSSQLQAEATECCGTSDQWNQKQALLTNAMDTKWNQPMQPENNYMSSEYGSHNFNHVNPALGYDIPHYANIPPPPCPRSVVTNSYHAVNMPQNMSNIPMMVQRPENGPNMVAWTNQPNIGSLVQTTAWKNKTNVVKKPKRTRTTFTGNQLMELEHEYAKAKYVDRNQRIELADKIRLNERTIKIWFQNRRIKEKKDRAESIEELDEVTLTGSPELVIPMPVQEQFPSNEMFHPQGVFVEHHTVSSISMPVPQVAAPVSYLPHAMSEDHPYNQGNFQEQHQYSSSYSGEDQELSSDSTGQSESSVSNTQGNMNESNWDFSWFRSLIDEEE